MSKQDSKRRKGYERSRGRFFGTSNEDGPILECVSCGTTLSAAEADDHDCPPADETRVLADGSGINFHRDLTAFQQDILFCLRRIERGESSEGQPYGLAIKRELEELRDVDIVNHGRLYPNLDELVDLGLIAKEMVDRRTNEYSTTNAGRQAIEDHAEWVLETVAERLEPAEAGGLQ